MSRAIWTTTVLCSMVLAGCGGDEKDQGTTAAENAQGGRSRGMSGAERAEDDKSRCSWDQPDREVSEYDTNGDEQPDVRKVFKQMGKAPNTHLVLICREADLNGDGIKDIVRYYNDEGRPVREEADRNFDGQMDELSYFQEGRTIRQELDTNADGQVDMKIFFKDGEPLRAERDMAGRSTANQWHPDRWEYYEEGRLVRMGTDLDGDGRADRWDRNQELADQIEREKKQNEDGEGASEEEGVVDDDIGGEDAGVGGGEQASDGADSAQG